MVAVENKKEGTLVNCFFCEHFHITDDVKLPYGCCAMGFESDRMPAVDVYNNTRMDCSLFVRKKISHPHGHHH